MLGCAHPNNIIIIIIIIIISKSSRARRSTWAAEDEAVDRAPRSSPVFLDVGTASSTSPSCVGDVLESETPNLADNRSLVNACAVQEVKGENVHWVPTHLMRADGLAKIFLQLLQELRDWLSEPLTILRDTIAKC